MNEISLNMLKMAVSAFIDGNMALAKEVAALDDKVDNYYAETYKKITEYLRETSRRNNTARPIIIHQPLP